MQRTTQGQMRRQRWRGWQGYREKSGGQASRRLTGPTTNQDERQGRCFDADDGKWNTEDDLSYTHRDEHGAGSSADEEDEEEKENGTLLFNVTSVQANLSDVYPPAWMRCNLSFFMFFSFSNRLKTQMERLPLRRHNSGGSSV